jgi:hypothetical protein
MVSFITAERVKIILINFFNFKKKTQNRENRENRTKKQIYTISETRLRGHIKPTFGSNKYT